MVIHWANKTSNKEILDAKGEFTLSYVRPKSLTGDEIFRVMFSKDVLPKNTVSVVCNEVHTAVH